MAQITLTTKKTGESFTINDEDLYKVTTLYVDDVASGSIVMTIDRADTYLDKLSVSESPSAIAALTTKLFQVTLTSRETPYLSIDKVKDVITNGSVANIIYNNNGNILETIETSMTTAQILAAINTGSNEPKIYRALLTQTGTDAPTADVLENSIGEIVWSYSIAGVYDATLVGAFPLTKTICFLNNIIWDGLVNNTWQRQTDDNCQLVIAAGDGFLGGSSLCAVEILVYP